ncbi:hypothetical protein R6Q57_023816 [Mikania cordata]
MGLDDASYQLKFDCLCRIEYALSLLCYIHGRLGQMPVLGFICLSIGDVAQETESNDEFVTAPSRFGLSLGSATTSRNVDYISSGVPSLNGGSSTLRVFTLAELNKATDNFDQSTKIGEGGFGSVHVGIIKRLEPLFDGICVAVKRGTKAMANRSGFSWEDSTSKPCEAKNMEMKVIFRDFKPSNVLLDENWNAKLSDFGLVREGPQDGRSHVSTLVVGTKGYAAPEYVQTGRLTSKIDVWSYGIFLEELITGRRPVNQKNSEIDHECMRWVCCYMGTGKSKLVVDPRLKDKYSVRSMEKISFIAGKCLDKNPKLRPTMNEAYSTYTSEFQALTYDEGS